MAARWICPTRRSGHVLPRPFRPTATVIFDCASRLPYPGDRSPIKSRRNTGSSPLVGLGKPAGTTAVDASGGPESRWIHQFGRAAARPGPRPRLRRQRRSAPRSHPSRRHPSTPNWTPRRLLRVLQAMRDGDFSVRLPSDRTGLPGKVADLVNDIAASNQRFAQAKSRRPVSWSARMAARAIASRWSDAPVPGARWKAR